MGIVSPQRKKTWVQRKSEIARRKSEASGRKWDLTSEIRLHLDAETSVRGELWGATRGSQGLLGGFIFSLKWGQGHEIGTLRVCKDQRWGVWPDTWDHSPELKEKSYSMAMISCSHTGFRVQAAVEWAEGSTSGAR